jgi:hypothetical protein
LRRSSAVRRTDYDGAWKEALDRYFEPFLRLCFPAVHAGIDWARGFSPLDQELQEVVRDAEMGKHRVDKLFRVYRHDGTEDWILVRFRCARHQEIPVESKPGRQRLHPGAVRVHSVERRCHEMGRSAAENRVLAAGRREDDAAVRQVAGMDVIG